MARSSPKGRASTRVPSQMVTTGPSKKPDRGAPVTPPKSNLGAAIKRTSDMPK